MKCNIPKLDPATQTPEKRGDIDKAYIVAYTKLHGTPEQRAEMKQFILDHTVERTSQLTKQPYKDIQLKEVRNKFCELFFPKLAETKKGNDKGFFDLVDEL